jgi:hypothetical protein
MLNMNVFSDAAPCSLIGNDRCFQGNNFLHHQGSIIALILKTLHISETSVNFYESTWRSITDGGYIFVDVRTLNLTKPIFHNTAISYVERDISAHTSPQ